MSNGYGVDFYGVAYYGYSQPIDYSVAPITASQTNYGELTIEWQSPNTTPWKSLNLVRSIYGFPSTPADGTSVITVTPSAALNSYDDLGLTPGQFYYYTMFLSLEAATWLVGTTYNQNDVILYNGLYWRSLQNSNTGNTPAVGSTFWVNTQYNPTWYPAGSTAGLVVANYNYSFKLYERTPNPYKIANSDIFSNLVVDNPALLHYLMVFGFHLDMTRTEYDVYLQGNNPDVISVTNLGILGNQLGIATDYLSSPQSRRQRVKNAAANYRLKGTPQSIHNAIADITGWDSVITPSRNLMGTGDVSALGHPNYDVWDADVVYFPNQLIQFQGYNYKNLVQAHGTAQQPTGTASSNTWWQAQIEQVDTVTLKNAQYYDGSSGYSNWFASNNPQPGYTGPTIHNGVVTGIQHPTITATKNWNALGFHSGSAVPAPGDLIANSNLAVEFLPAAWSSGTNYVIGNPVDTGATDYFYRAVKPSGPGTPYGAITPGTNESFWMPVFYSPLPSYVWYQTEILTPHEEHWNPQKQYYAGDQVELFGIIYEAISDNINSSPTGNYYSNADWIFVKVPDDVYTASAYVARVTSNTTSVKTFVNMGYTYNSPFGTNAGFDSLSGPTVNYNNRFVADYADLNGNNDNSLANLNKPWTATPSTANLWRSSYGMASVDQTLNGTTAYTYLTYADGRANVTLHVTFASDFVDTVHKAHGIIFRFQNASNFWYTTRQSLYLRSGGVDTLIGSWPRLADGERMIVAANGSSIEVLHWDGGLQQTLFSTTNATLSTQTTHGLIQKYSASGAV